MSVMHQSINNSWPTSVFCYLRTKIWIKIKMWLNLLPHHMLFFLNRNTLTLTCHRLVRFWRNLFPHGYVLPETHIGSIEINVESSEWKRTLTMLIDVWFTIQPSACSYFPLLFTRQPFSLPLTVSLSIVPAYLHHRRV